MKRFEWDGPAILSDFDNFNQAKHLRPAEKRFIGMRGLCSYGRITIGIW